LPRLHDIIAPSTRRYKVGAFTALRFDP